MTLLKMYPKIPNRFFLLTSTPPPQLIRLYHLFTTRLRDSKLRRQQTTTNITTPHSYRPSLHHYPTSHDVTTTDGAVDGHWAVGKFLPLFLVLFLFLRGFFILAKAAASPPRIYSEEWPKRCWQQCHLGRRLVLFIFLLLTMFLFAF